MMQRPLTGLAVPAVAMLLGASALAQSGSQPAATGSGSGDAASPRADQEIGKSFEVRVETLPKPYETEATSAVVLTTGREGRRPTLPAGFELALVAQNLENPRQVLALPNGDLMVAHGKPGYLTLLSDEDGDGQADIISRYASGFSNPYGMAHRSGEILVADESGIWTVGYKPGQIRSYPQGATPVESASAERKQPKQPASHSALATGVFGAPGGHNSRDLEIGPDGRLYVGVGSLANIAIEPDIKATIQSFSASGGDQTTYASGTRNPAGLAIHPESGRLWAVVQERDNTGDRLVPDYLIEVEEGAFYGWPYAWIGNNPMPGFASQAPEKVEETVAPDLLFEAHSAAMDLAFSTTDALGPDYASGAFVALKGSWNRKDPTGYKVVWVPFEEGAPTGSYQNFMAGFWVEGESPAVVWGRPSDVEIGPEGALYVVDDTGGTIWRVTRTDSTSG